MEQRQAVRGSAAGLLGLALLLWLWQAESIGSSLVLAGLGALALGGYAADRARQRALLAPGGLLLSLGLGLAVVDATHGTAFAWLMVMMALGLGLAAIYLVEHEHVWALGFGGLLAICAAGASVLLIAGPLITVGTPLALLGITAGSTIVRRRRRQEYTWQS